MKLLFNAILSRLRETDQQLGAMNKIIVKIFDLCCPDHSNY